MDGQLPGMAVGSSVTNNSMGVGSGQLGQVPEAQSGQAGSSASPHTRKAANRWTAQEHARLCQLVELYGPRRWPEIAAQLPGRKGKQCRERWLNHGMDTKSRSKKGNWTPEEEYVLVSLHAVNGTQWRRMVECLPGRTDNDIKNHFYATWRCKMDENTSSLLWVYIQQLKQSSAPAPEAALNTALVTWETAMPKDVVSRMLGYLPSQHPDGPPDGRSHPLITISPVNSDEADDYDEAEAEAGLQQLQQQQPWGHLQGPPSKRACKSLGDHDDAFSQEDSSRNTNAVQDATGGEVMQQYAQMRTHGKHTVGLDAPGPQHAGNTIPVQLLTSDGVVTLYSNPGTLGGNTLNTLQPPASYSSHPGAAVQTGVLPAPVPMVSARNQPMDVNAGGVVKPTFQAPGQSHLGFTGSEDGGAMVTLATVASMQEGGMPQPTHVHHPVPRSHSSNLSCRTTLHPARDEARVLLASRSGSLPAPITAVAGQLLQSSPPQQPSRQLSSLSQQAPGLLLSTPTYGPSAAAALLQAGLSLGPGTFSAISGPQLVNAQQTGTGGLAGQQHMLVHLVQPGTAPHMQMAPMQVDAPQREQLQLYSGSIVQQLQQQQQQLQQQLQVLQAQQGLQRVVPAPGSEDFTFQLQTAITGQVPVPPQSNASFSTHFAASTSAGMASQQLQYSQAPSMVLSNSSSNTSPTLTSSAATPTAPMTGQYAMLTLSDGSIQLLPLASISAAPTGIMAAMDSHNQPMTANLPTAFAAATSAAAVLCSQPSASIQHADHAAMHAMQCHDPTGGMKAHVMAVPDHMVSMGSGNMHANLPTTSTTALLSLGSGQAVASHGQVPGSSPVCLSLDSQGGSSPGHMGQNMTASMVVVHNQDALPSASQLPTAALPNQ